LKYQGVKIWNSVPNKLKNYNSVHSKQNTNSICC